MVLNNLLSLVKLLRSKSIRHKNMSNSEVVTLLHSKVLDNLSGKELPHADQPYVDFDNEWKWDNYAFNFYDEYEDYYSFEDEGKEKSLEITDIDEQDDIDERSTITILTPEEIEIEISNESKDSSIHFCFRNIDISDSQLKIRNIFNLYVVPTDPGITSAFWGIHRRSKVYLDDFLKFKDVTEVMGLRPISCLKDMFKKSKIDLGYYGFDPRIFRAICEALFENSTVENLDIRDNYLTVDACYHLNQVLLKNTLLSSINLSGCRIGAQGAKRLREGLSLAPALQYLNLSHCQLGDEGFHHISSGIYLSEVIESVDLSDNQLSQGSAKNLETMILKADNLRELDLSWNFLYKDICRYIFGALMDNKNLENINLSWNTLGSDCTPYLCTFLLKPTNLKNLNLNGNMFNDTDAQQIAKVLSKNSNLEKFYIGNNPLKAGGAIEIIQSLTLEKAPENRINLLDLRNIWLKKNVLATLENIENTKPWLNIKFAGVLGNFKLVGPNEKVLFLKRANFEAMNTKKKKERKEFGHFVLSLENTTIPIEEFATLVKAFKLKISDTLVHAIAKAFETGKNLVDQGELKAFYLKEYPDSQLPPEKEKKAKKRKKDKADKKGKEPKREKAPDAIENEVKTKGKKTKHKSKTSKVPPSELLVQENEFDNNEDRNLEDFETIFEF